MGFLNLEVQKYRAKGQKPLGYKLSKLLASWWYFVFGHFRLISVPPPKVRRNTSGSFGMAAWRRFDWGGTSAVGWLYMPFSDEMYILRPGVLPRSGLL